MHTERNFGELEFFENPIHALLAPSTEASFSASDDALGEEAAAASSVQLRRVFEREATQRRLFRERPLHKALLEERDEKDVAAARRSLERRLESFEKERRAVWMALAKLEARNSPSESATQTRELRRQLGEKDAEFEAFLLQRVAETPSLFEAFLKLHASLLLAHACGEDGASARPHAASSLFGECSIASRWTREEEEAREAEFRDFKGPAVARASRLDGLWWKLLEATLGVPSRRTARREKLPLVDVSALRLSAEIDRLVVNASMAVLTRVAETWTADSAAPPTSRIGSAFWRVLSSGRLFRNLRRACLQLRSPRRPQQRSHLQGLFERQISTSKVSKNAFTTPSVLQEFCASSESRRTRLVASKRPNFSSWLATLKSSGLPAMDEEEAMEASVEALAASAVVEVVETKAWVLARVFDVKTARLVFEKLISTFASKQHQREESRRERGEGIGSNSQWACEGWAGKTEDRFFLMYSAVLAAAALLLLVFPLALTLCVALVLRRVLKRRPSSSPPF